jgi:hypothetical protein
MSKKGDVANRLFFPSKNTVATAMATVMIHKATKDDGLV